MISALPTIAHAAAQIRSGELEPLELVEFCLERIHRHDDTIRAWVTVCADDARNEAVWQGAMVRRGENLGPLHGIPVGIKDIIDVGGLPTTAGSPLRQQYVAAADAPVVAKLRQAGAIILGKTVTTEFACFDPPPTRNPWNRQQTPGGSSSGSAAAVALEMCCAALGSQTGGSIIRPASYCGVAGLKPTRGRVSTEGVVPVSPWLDHVGPIARWVDDLRRVFDVIETGPRPAPTLETVYVCEEYFFTEATEDVLLVTDLALGSLKEIWHTLQPLPLPASFAAVHAMHRRLMAVDAAEYHRVTFARQRDAFGPQVASLIEEGLATRAVDYAAALRHQRQFQADMAACLPAGSIAVMPATTCTAPARDSTGDPRFNSPWSYAGLPAVTIPCGLAANGLPCGLQLVAARDADALLLEAAAAAEQHLNFTHRPPDPLPG